LENKVAGCYFYTISDDVYILASGGDDNCLVLTEICIKDSPTVVTSLRQVRQASAHATQITGIRFLREQLMTVSIDQRAIIWKWSFGNKVLENFSFSSLSGYFTLDLWNSSAF
jgi:hypothetical protein